MNNKLNIISFKNILGRIVSKRPSNKIVLPHDKKLGLHVNVGDIFLSQSQSNEQNRLFLMTWTC